MLQFWPARHNVPISKAARAGDFVFTSAFGPWLFDPADVMFGPDGAILDDGTGLKGMVFEEQVERTFGFLEEALAAAGCGLAEVVETRAWLAEARDFAPFNVVYARHMQGHAPVRSVFPSAFMFCCRVEMQMIAYKPLDGSGGHA
jgi:enamine deaminase RidA (YjgF/YER057c/UK114 family)